MKYTVTLFFIFVFFQTNAQDTLNSQPKWELGVDLLSPFRAIRLDELNSTYGLIVKRNISRKGALRFKTNLGFDYDPDPAIQTPTKPHDYNVSFDLGFERRKVIKRFVHFYGADVLMRIRQSDRIFGIGLTGNGASYSQSKESVNSLGVTAFTGGKYYIAERLSLSLETSMNLIYGKIKSSAKQLDANGQIIKETIVSGASNSVNLSIRPISVLYLSYHF